MTAEPISYADSRGRQYVGYLTTPVAPKGSGVLIAHNLPGVGTHERELSQRLADLGHIVLAADYHGNGRTLKKSELMDFVTTNTADPTYLREALPGALAALQKQPSVQTHRIAAIGYCYGGLVALELARTGAPLAVTVGLHSSLPIGAVEEARAIKGQVLILNAANDPYVSQESRRLFEEQMNEAGLDWRMMLFGSTDHGFTVRGDDIHTDFALPNISYSQRSDERSWKMMMDVFAETIDRTE